MSLQKRKLLLSNFFKPLICVTSEGAYGFVTEGITLQWGIFQQGVKFRSSAVCVCVCAVCVCSSAHTLWFWNERSPQLYFSTTLQLCSLSPPVLFQSTLWQQSLQCSPLFGCHGHSEVVVFCFAIYPVREGYDKLAGVFSSVAGCVDERAPSEEHPVGRQSRFKAGRLWL